MWTRRAVTRLVWPLGALVACGGGERARPLRLATTTSVHDSGLMGVLGPAFTAARGRPVEVVAVGSKRAIELLATGQVDGAVTHSPVEEAQALASGRIGGRTPVMRSAYVLVGPAAAAGVVAGATDIRGALRAVAGSGRRFVARDAESGTHQRELQLWAAAGVPAEGPFILRAQGSMAEALVLAAREHASPSAIAPPSWPAAAISGSPSCFRAAPTSTTSTPCSSPLRRPAATSTARAPSSNSCALRRAGA